MKTSNLEIYYNQKDVFWKAWTVWLYVDRPQQMVHFCVNWLDENAEPRNAIHFPTSISKYNLICGKRKQMHAFIS